MPKVRFIRLNKPEKALHLCQLAERYFNAGRRVLIRIADENQAVTLDQFMWTWKKGTFLPHACDNGTVECHDEPVVIALSERNPNAADLLILAAPCSLEFIRQFEQVIDFAELYDPDLAQASRDRFARYRETGFDTGMHE